jgi:exodeoxyribonuclease VII large subunit
MNKELEMPFLCRRIAVISSETAAGYGDFYDQLLNNPFQFKFYLKLFPAVMQGREAEKSIIAALDKIYRYESLFDVVVLIRGGGSKADLSCFDSYWLAYHITQFPVPVLTGIGHEQDDSVADLVAYLRFKTPTAVASYLIGSFSEHAAALDQLKENISIRSTELIRSLKEKLSCNIDGITGKTKELLLKNNARLRTFNYSFVTSVKKLIHLKELSLKKRVFSLHISSRRYNDRKKNTLNNLYNILKKNLSFTLTKQQGNLERIGDKIDYLNPEKVLKRGYSVTMKNGIVLKDTKSLDEGDILETKLYKGKITSELKKKES